MARLAPRTLVAILVAAGLLSACGGSGGNTARDGSASYGRADASELTAKAGAVQAAPKPPGVLAQVPPTKPDQQIVYTSNLGVRVRHLDAAIDAAAAIGDRAGGFVFSQTAAYDGGHQAQVSLRVPPNSFRPVLTRLRRLGTLLDQDIKAEDVTRQVSDLKGQLETAQTSARRLRELLARAAATRDILDIETQLEQREQQIESVQGQINTLNSQVEYATIDLTLSELGVAKVSKDIPGFGRGLHAGWVALVDSGKVVLTGFGAVLPFLPIALLLALVAVWLRRSRRAAIRSES